MSGEIKKNDSIKNMAVFQDFSWASSVRDNGNNIAEFKKISAVTPKLIHMASGI
ncbi:MAG: hypothetical protein JRD04_00110 [Deltaproteobacteria bacterium]|nr:hypothetical protein [Deltaproteobacteria bacterium]